jgi:hypothetical protein
VPIGIQAIFEVVGIQAICCGCCRTPWSQLSCPSPRDHCGILFDDCCGPLTSPTFVDSLTFGTSAHGLLVCFCDTFQQWQTRHI